MPIIIREIVTEVVLQPVAADRTSTSPLSRGNSGAHTSALSPDLEVIVRRATERVLETLRREWDR